MKVDKKNVQSDPRVTQELLLFQDKLFINYVKKKAIEKILPDMTGRETMYYFLFLKDMD